MWQPDAMRTVSFVVALSVVFFASASASAQVVWSGDFETGDTSQFRNELNGMVMGRDYIVVQTETVTEGTYAARVELHNDAVWPNGLKRVELNHRPDDARTAEGAELHFAWSFYLPETLPTDPSQTIGYWESASSYQQMMALRLSGEDLVFITRKPTNVTQWTGTGVATPGEWHRVALHVLWSKDETIGRVDLWFDGMQVVTDAAAQTLADDNPHFTQIGLLRGAIEFTDTPVIYLDDAVEGDSLDDVRPDLAGLPMMDAGVPDGALPDASPVDSATADTSTPPPPDASVDASADTSTTSPGDDGGCGCGSTGSARGVPLSVALVFLALLGTRRRRR